ncbi:ketoacyl reductase [Alcanivorax sp. 521-1]|uniref:Ketoacyl reductase n=1 Tax=Alloalcanivorax profundimaris TaxID=2735259 RepID=A0ABS0AWC3_9GAMM|nr:SDR family NAD(P)-dependent oxidoreductase [Alloalcanivorax profundimaris]MBF5057877.1 ketoacyl reductase [Alloalcanivorax profundimaris]
MTGTVLITGAAGGIGQELTRLFAADGYRVLAFDLRGDALEALGEDLPDGCDYRPVAMDLSEPDAATRVADWLDQHGLPVDVLINNVGFGLFGEHVEQDATRVGKMLAVNNQLLAQLCLLIGKRMKDAGGGRILNIGSLAGFCPMTYFAAYSASKAFVINFSASLGEELKPHGVRVTCYCPTTTRTGFLNTAQSRHASSQGITRFVTERVDGPAEVARGAWRALHAGKRFALPGWSVTAQSMAIRMLPLRFMAWFVRRKAEA